MSKFTVEFGVENVEYLLEALKKADYDYMYDEHRQVIVLTGLIKIDLNNRQIEYSRYSGIDVEAVANKIKRNYSRVVLEKVAVKNKWLLKKKAEQRKYEFRRY
jgi:hypothetical protein